IERYKEGPQVVDQALADITDDELDLRPASDDWTPRQVVHHLADSEIRHRLLRWLRAARHGVVSMVLVGGLVTIAACHASLPGPAVTAGRISADAASCKDTSLTDLDQESHYEADYLERWKTWDGCTLRLDVVMTRHGECIDGVDDIVFAWPLEVTKKPYANLRIY